MKPQPLSGLKNGPCGGPIDPPLLYYQCRHPTITVVILLPLSSSYYHCRHPTTIVVILLPLSYLAHSSIFETTMIECYKLEDSLQTRRFSTPSLRETISHTSGPGNPIPTPLPMQLPVTLLLLARFLCSPTSVPRRAQCTDIGTIMTNHKSIRQITSFLCCHDVADSFCRHSCHGTISQNRCKAASSMQ